MVRKKKNNRLKNNYTSATPRVVVVKTKWNTVSEKL